MNEEAETHRRWRSGVVALVALAALAACGPNEQRKTAFKNGLIALANKVERRTYARPVPAPTPVVGTTTFGEAFDAAVKERQALEAVVDLATRCGDDLAARRDDAARACRESLDDSTAPALRTLLDLRRSERPGTPPSVHPFAPMQPSAGVHRSLTALCARARVEIYAQLAQARPAEAAATCIQTLQVARDYGAGASLVGAMVVASCIERVDDPCARALAEAPPPSPAARREELTAVASSLPSFLDAFDAEQATIHLGLCAPLLDAADRRQLGPKAMTVVAEGDKQAADMSWTDRRMLAALCVEGFEDLDRVAKAYRAPAESPERTRLLAEREAHETKMPKMSYGKYEERLAAAQAKVRALAAR